MNGGRLLVLENDASLREALQFALEHAGYTVVAAGTDRDAVRAAEEFRPDVLIVDVNVRTRFGLALLATRREDEALAAIPMLVLAFEPHRVPQAALVGVAEVAAKPIERALLLRLIRERMLSARPDDA